MPKMKTSKTARKRFKTTGTGKLLKRAVGQDHFNARERGATTRSKRRDTVTKQVLRKNLRTLFTV